MKKVTICFVGPMLGGIHGWVPNPMELLAPLLDARGYSTYLTSRHSNRYCRLIDIVSTVFKLRRKVDILCIQVYGGSSFVIEDIISNLGQQLGLPIIMVLHGGAMPDFMARYPRWSKRVLQRAQVIITPSSFLAKTIEPYGLQAQVIPNAIDLSKYLFQLRRNIRPRLLWMRTFHPIYNPILAIDVLARVRGEYPEATLTMAGQEKGMLEKVQDYVDHEGLREAVTFAGFLDSKGKRNHFQKEDLFLNTNRVDNMPVSVVEAAACGLPIISTEVGGIPFLLTDEQDSLLVPDGDDEAMAIAVLRLLADHGQAEQISRNARKLAEKHDWEVITPLWETIFGEVMATK